MKLEDNSIVATEICKDIQEGGLIDVFGMNISIPNVTNYAGLECLVRLDEGKKGLMGNIVKVREQKDPDYLKVGCYSLYASVYEHKPPNGLDELNQFYNPGRTGIAFFFSQEGIYRLSYMNVARVKRNMHDICLQQFNASNYPLFWVSNNSDNVRYFCELSYKNKLKPIRVDTARTQPPDLL